MGTFKRWEKNDFLGKPLKEHNSSKKNKEREMQPATKRRRRTTSRTTSNRKEVKDFSITGKEMQKFATETTGKPYCCDGCSQFGIFLFFSFFIFSTPTFLFFCTILSA